MPVTPTRYQAAIQLIEKHFRISLHTLDALQLAVALALSHQGMIDHFVCADQRLCDTATDEGLSVILSEWPVMRHFPWMPPSEVRR